MQTIDIVHDQSLLSALESFLEIYKEGINKSPAVPVEVFSNSLGILEGTVKYLKENLGLQFAEIAKLLNRDQRTVFAAYQDAVKKHKARLSPKDNFSVPASIFSNRSLGPLEALTLYLKETGWSFKKISQSTNRSYNTVWLSCKNARKKVPT